MRNIRQKLMHLAVVFGLFFAFVFITGCTESSSPEPGQGQLKLTMVDAPADYDAINIVVTRVEVHKADADSNSGWFIINNNTATYDLLTLRNGASVVLGDTPLDAGIYTQIRLIIGTGSNIVVDGITYPLEIPSGEQTGIKLNHQFEIQSGLLYELLLDFDAAHSIILTGSGQYKLKPVIRLVPMVTSGTISGQINPVSAAGYVYAISGTDTAGTIAEPITGYFMLMSLLQRTYTVEVISADTLYNDTTITNVIVTAQQNTDLGIISLSLK